MAVNLSAAVANAILNALCRSTPWVEPDAVFVQLHIGSPGAAGTSNPAIETDRVQATFGTNASGGAISNTSVLTWTGVAGSEDYTHFSAWDAASAGNFLFSGTVTANAVTAGDDFNVAVGELDVSLPVAS